FGVCFTATASAALYALSLHDALPILVVGLGDAEVESERWRPARRAGFCVERDLLDLHLPPVALRPLLHRKLSARRDRREGAKQGDRKSTRLNSSHVASSYAVFCLKKK